VAELVMTFILPMKRMAKNSALIIVVEKNTGKKMVKEIRIIKN
jgi:hypothetical protein